MTCGRSIIVASATRIHAEVGHPEGTRHGLCPLRACGTLASKGTRLLALQNGFLVGIAPAAEPALAARAGLDAGSVSEASPGR